MLFAAAASFVLLSVQAHDLQYVKRGDSKVPFFYPKSESKQAPASLSPAKDTTKAAIQLIAQEYNVRPEELKVSNAFTTPRGITHVYLDRVINGVVVANHNAAVHFTNGVPSSVTSSFGHADSFAQPQVVNKISISAKDAISAAEKYLGAKKNQIPVKKHFLELPGGKIALCYDLQVQSDNVFASVSVDAASGQVVRVVNFNNDFTYKAVELPKWTPDSGFSDVKDPEFAAASPNGWTAGSTTTGNNADVHTPSNVRGVGTNGKFDSTFDVKKDAEDPKNVQAGSVNLFYVVNKMHDISYQYGFNEAAGNFQNNNFGKGGIGNDAVNVIHQTGRQNNAFFSTPPDGQQGVMKMFVFNNGRDGGLDSVIPMHEFTHGISNRLTGGPNNIGCLNSMESGSMGEGWSDAVALFLHRNKSETRKSDRGVGTWVGGEPETGLGARSYKYSTDLDVNPLTFDIVGTGDEVHDIGTAWATMLNEVYWNLVDKNGFSENWYDAKQSAGNIVALQLVISGMMLQPCNPTFTQARDAILQADKNLYGGVHQCDIWKGFAKRGLGIDAVQSTHANGFKLPEQCNAKPTTSASSTVATSTSIPTSSSATSIKTSTHVDTSTTATSLPTTSATSIKTSTHVDTFSTTATSSASTVKTSTIIETFSSTATSVATTVTTSSATKVETSGYPVPTVSSASEPVYTSNVPVTTLLPTETPSYPVPKTEPTAVPTTEPTETPSYPEGPETEPTDAPQETSTYGSQGPILSSASKMEMSLLALMMFF